LAEEFVAVLGGITPEGTGFRIDPDLRPEGKTGPLARSLDSYRAYYERWADTWEFQSLIKARPVAGDSGLGAAFGDLITPFVYRSDFDNGAVREIRTMKARIERERIPPGEDPGFHMKLGKGGLTDVAFACQLLQMRFGAARAELRGQGTIESIAALERAGLLTTGDAGALADSYRFCSQLRNRLFLQAGRARESFPADPEETNRLALSLGFDVAPRAALRNRYLKLTRRARRVVERRFYRD
jgi:glutamate-ammonia-ligase adenylyltransferase